VSRYRTDYHRNRASPWSSPFPRPGRLARHGGGVNGGACAIASDAAGAIDSDDVTWRIFGRGSGDPESKDSQAVVVVFTNNTGCLLFSQLQTLIVCGRIVLSGCV
jgi:hypothetical protein